MKIKTLKFSLFLLAILAAFMSCKEDDTPTGTFVERDRAEQQVADKDSLLTYLATHYYNSSFFETGTNHRYSDIVISELPKDEEGNYLELPNPDENTILLESENLEIKTYDFLDVNYEYYILNLNNGGGEAPKFTDAVRVRYEGTSVTTNEVFDAISSPEELPLVGNGFTTFGTIKAWQLVMPLFNAAADFTIQGNGTVSYNDYGLGVMFVPSGLAYFSGSNTGTSYDNLIFKFELLQFERVDHDNDGIPSYLEDLNDDQNVNNDDTDEDNFFNFIDVDDDGDDVLTIDELIPTVYVVDTNNNEEEPVLAENEFEISRSVNAGVITINTVTIADANTDGIPDYLDANITTNYNEE